MALVLGAAAAALLLFLHGFVRLRRRGRTDHAGWGRLVLFVAGVACATAPLVWLGDRSLSGHMFEHMLLADAAPALVLLALRGPLLFFVVPAALLRRVAPVRSVVSWVFRPSVALWTWALVFATWHIPATYELAVHVGGMHVLQHASFGLAGLLVWTQLVDPARRGRLTLPQRLAFAGGLFALGQVLGNVLLLAPDPIYSSYGSLRDQQHAGLVMMGEQLVTLGLWTLLLLQRGGFFRVSSPAAHGTLTPAGRIS